MDYHQNARLTIHGRERLSRMVLERGLTLTLAAASVRYRGRWSRPGTRVVYWAQHLSLAMIE
jgi:hypothetical protein